MQENKSASAEISQRWNHRYQQDGADRSTRRPNQLLLDHADLLPSQGLALDAGAGAGKNSLFLARHGLQVISLDISEIGLQFLNQQRCLHALPIAPAVCNLAQPWLPADYFDLIINFRFLERALFPFYRKALKKGGVLVFSTFVQPTAEHPDKPFFLKSAELTTTFHDFTILHHSQNSFLHNRSGTTRHVENLIARK